ncbi:MAG: flagellar biosynthesis protein FlhF [Gammaproteobacteria bacterium]
MNIRRFTAQDMRDALRDIRSTLGPDAVMLSSRKTLDGVEVIAAMDYDDHLLAAVGDKPASDTPDGAALEIEDTDLREIRAEDHEPPTYEEIAQAMKEPEPVPTPQPAPMSAENKPLEEKPAVELSAEIKDLRNLLEGQMASLAWNDLNRRAPGRARALRQLSRLGVDSALARELADQLPITTSQQDAWRLPLQKFAARLPLATRELDEVGGIFAIVGPTGVGKTTSIAKIAARFALRHDISELGLVSTDSYRIGAREQLLTFARILGAPMHVAENADELRSVLDSLSSKKLVLIDTAGMSQRDIRLTNQFATLKAAGHQIHSILTVSAAAGKGSLAETLKVFKAADPKAMIVTKLDEATSLGPILSLAIQNEMPVAYLSDGQRVPEDLDLAGPKRTWLMQRAAQLVRDHEDDPDEDELAREFGSMELVANG